MKKLFILTIVLVFVTTASGCDIIRRLHKEPEFEQDKFRVGLILPLTGPAAPLGISARNAAEMAYDSLTNDAKSSIELKFEDDQADSTKTVTAFKKLTDFDKANTILTIFSNASSAASPLAEEKKIPLIALATGSPQVIKDKEYVVSLWVNEKAQADNFVAEIEKQNYKNIGLVITNHEGMLSLAEHITDQLQAKGLENTIVLREQFNPDNKDFRSFITKAKAKDIDACLVLLMTGQPGLFAKQARELSLDIPLVGTGAFESNQEIATSSGALNNQHYISINDASPEFYSEYQKKYGSNATVTAGIAYDAIKIIAQSIEKYGNDQNKLNWYLHNLNGFNGILGIYGSNGNNGFTLTASTKIIKDGRYEKLY